MTALTYVDSSVLIKRVIDEPGSAEARHRLHSQTGAGDTLMISTVGVVEVHRAIRRVTAGARSDEEMRVLTLEALEDVYTIAIDETVLSIAREIPVRHLGTLDAIHIATALLAEAGALLTDDQQMARACEEVGLSVA